MLRRVGVKSLPTGTVTLLFTDVEGSTKLLHALGAAGYAEALAAHRRVLRAAFERHRGVEVDTQGDAFFFAFADAPSGLAAASEARSALESGPISVRMGIHTGRPLRTEEGYVGVDVHRAARIAAAGHGGQVLVSLEAAALAEVSGPALVDLGEHRLKDLAAPERIYQLGDGSFPPLKALSASNLPVPTTPFLGREAELERLSARLTDPGVRVLTILGPGGIGKTRLALQAAAEASDSFLDGLWWVALAPLRDALQAPLALAQTLGVREEEGIDVEDALATRLEGRRTLVLLDNAEHLLPELAGWVARLLAASDRLTVVVTSRERLQLSSESIFTVPVLTAEDANAFLQERAAALGLSLERSETMAALCERLDRLPLALQLAAARLRTFSPEQLLERFTARLDVLKGGRDLEPRQQTLRATLEWSHDLLAAVERTLFRHLAVFVGGCTLEAAEAVCGADPDVLEALVDKSLLQRHDDAPEPRFWMLESIQDFAAERLDAAGEVQEFRARHGRYFHELAERMDLALRAGEPEEGPVSVLEADINNLRAAVEFGLETGDVEIVREITASLPMYWIVRGLYGEARSWLERALALVDLEDDTRRRLLSALGTIAYAQGDHPAAVAASDEAATLASRLGGATERLELLKEQALAALRKKEFETAETLLRERLDVAVAVGNGVGTSSCRLNLAYIANKTRRHDRAEALLAENLPFVRSKGQTRCEAYTLAGIAETTVHRDRPQDCAGNALLGATRAFQIRDNPLTAYCLDLFAASAAARGDGRRAATILGATDAAREAMGVEPDEDESAIRARALELIGAEGTAVEAARAEGRELDLDSALELARRAT
jgi:predicted ATPase/class 3 adenylate cyclase